MAVKVAVIAVAMAALIVDWMAAGDMGVMEAPIAIMIATPVDGGVICSYDGSADGWVVVAVVVGGCRCHRRPLVAPGLTNHRGKIAPPPTSAAKNNNCNPRQVLLTYSSPPHNFSDESLLPIIFLPRQSTSSSWQIYHQQQGRY